MPWPEPVPRSGLPRRFPEPPGIRPDQSPCISPGVLLAEFWLRKDHLPVVLMPGRGRERMVPNRLTNSLGRVFASMSDVGIVADPPSSRPNPARVFLVSRDAETPRGGQCRFAASGSLWLAPRKLSRSRHNSHPKPSARPKPPIQKSKHLRSHIGGPRRRIANLVHLVDENDGLLIVHQRVRNQLQRGCPGAIRASRQNPVRAARHRSGT